MNNKYYLNLFNISKNFPQAKKIFKNMKILKKTTKKYCKIPNVNKDKLNYYIIIKKISTKKN